MRAAPETATFGEAEAALGEGFCPAFPRAHGQLDLAGHCAGCAGSWLGDCLLISVAPRGWMLPPDAPPGSGSTLPLSITFGSTWTDSR